MACSTRSLYGPGFSLNFHFSPSQRMLQDCLMAVTCHGFHISIRSCTSFRSHGCRNWTFRRPCRFCKMMWLLVSVQISSLNKQIVLIGCIVYIDTQVIFMAIFSVPVAVPVPPPPRYNFSCHLQILLNWTMLLKHRNIKRQWPLLLTWFNFNPSMDK